MDACHSDRESHIKWAFYGLFESYLNLSAYLHTKEPAYALEAFKHAYGAEINFKDAGLLRAARGVKHLRDKISKEILKSNWSKPSFNYKIQEDNRKELHQEMTPRSKERFWKPLIDGDPESVAKGRVKDFNAYSGPLEAKVPEKQQGKKIDKLVKIQASLSEAAILIGMPLKTQPDYGSESEDPEDLDTI